MVLRAAAARRGTVTPGLVVSVLVAIMAPDRSRHLMEFSNKRNLSRNFDHPPFYHCTYFVRTD